MVWFLMWLTAARDGAGSAVIAGTVERNNGESAQGLHESVTPSASATEDQNVAEAGQGAGAGTAVHLVKGDRERR